jgi:polysaccharide biosynthesis transport protein
MNETSDATSIFAPIWRRKWLILAVGIIVAAASYFYYKRQRPTYQATTQVYLGAAAEEQAPGEKASKNRGSTLSDQAAVINAIVVEQVRNRLRAEKKGKLARQTKVKAKAPEKSEFITITTEGHTAKGVALVANLTAQTYIRRAKDNHRRSIERALAISRRQLKRIELSALAKAEKPTKKKTGSGPGDSSTTSSGPSASSVIQEANLSSKINQLESSLETVSAQQVKRAKPSTATMLSPKPRKDAIFGFVLGIVLAAIAAYALSRLDRRLRSISAVETVTGLPLLSAMPKVRRPIVAGAGQSPRPSAHLLEPLRRLQAGLRLTDASATGAASANPPRIILFVSPDPGDGKSTIVADLALVQRDAGERVVVVEANFRRPVQNRLLGIEGEGRLGSVLAGQLDVDGGAQRVIPAASAAAAGEASPGGTATAVQARVGSLFVLGGDRSVANPPALLERQAVGELLRSLAETFDYVLVDVPSPLEVSDAMPLLGIVDRIVVVARVGHTREASAQRLRQLLGGASSAPVAGVVANFVADSELKRYGFSRARAGLWPGGQRSGR